MHPLDGAYERINGARENLNVLKPLIEDFAQVVANGVSLDYKESFVTIKGMRRRVPRGTASFPVNVPAPPKASRLIGEVVQNLRTSLDYLVYELACFDAKGIVDGTQFPVADTEEIFKDLIRRYHLNVLTPEHVAAIKKLQPLEGCHWTKRLAFLSNPDKHRHLTVVKSPVVISVDPLITKEILKGHHVGVENYATITITFSDGAPVIESLEQLILMVVKTLEDFKPEFK
jgi:hypothetical protein